MRNGGKYEAFSARLRFRGQVTIEYMLILGLISMVFIVAINSIASGYRTHHEAVWSSNARSLSRQIANEIDKAHVGGDGYAHNMTIPIRLKGGVDYNITVRPRLVTVNTFPYEREFEFKTVTADIDGASGGMTLSKGVLTFENVGGAISITGW